MHNRPLRIEHYAINGTGLGHLTRQLNIARDLRELLARLQVPSEIGFLTTSEAPQIAHDFLVTKIPSKTVVKASGLNTRRFAARARLLIGNYLSGIQPDVLVVDTDPRGSFHEMAQVGGFAKSLVLVDRHKDEKVAERNSFQLHSQLYNLIVVPEDNAPHLAGNSKVRTVGKIQGFLPENALSRQDAREFLGVSSEERLLYLTGGGGGDATLQNCFDRAISSLAALPKTILLVGYGPLYRGDMCFSKRNVIPIQSSKVSSYFQGVDCAISAAGYNSHEELLAAGVPTLFYAQKKGMDRQDLRIRDSMEHGWCEELSSFNENELRTQVEQFLTGPAGRVRDALRRRAFPNGNVHAARHILRLALARRPYRIRPEEVDEVSEQLIQERANARDSLLHHKFLPTKESLRNPSKVDATVKSFFFECSPF